MHLVIDLGNTAAKVAVFSASEMLVMRTVNAVTVAEIDQLAEEFPKINRVILSSVVNHDPALEDRLRQHWPLVVLDHTTEIPIINEYDTPETLGRDRLAAAIGAHALYPNDNVLVIDCGTCIKYDLATSDGRYLGGAISPGLDMRFKALHTFTDQLPLVTNPGSQPSLMGASTAASISSGVINGALAEVKGTIESYEARFQQLTTVFTGGDANRLRPAELSGKKRIFALPNLVLQGLNAILQHHEDRQLQQ